MRAGPITEYERPVMRPVGWNPGGAVGAAAGSAAPRGALAVQGVGDGNGEAGSAFCPDWLTRLPDGSEPVAGVDVPRSAFDRRTPACCSTSHASPRHQSPPRRRPTRRPCHAHSNDIHAAHALIHATHSPAHPHWRRMLESGAPRGTLADRWYCASRAGLGVAPLAVGVEFPSVRILPRSREHLQPKEQLFLSSDSPIPP